MKLLAKLLLAISIMSLIFIASCGQTETKTCPVCKCPPPCPQKSTLPIIKNAIAVNNVKAYWIDLALDKKGFPYISYYNADSKSLWMATVDDKGNWINEKVDDDGDVGQYSQIVVVNGEPIIAYYDATNGRLKLAYRKNGLWNITIIDNSPHVGTWIGMAADKNGMIHISYIDEDNEDLKYARWDGKNSIVQEVDDGITEAGGGVIVRQTSIALDSLGYPHIAYYDGFLGDLRYAYYDPQQGEWIKEVIDDPPEGDSSQEDLGKWNSIVLDKNNNPYIAYSDSTNFKIKVAYKINGQWKREMLMSPDMCEAYVNIVLLNGIPFVSYFDSTYSDLRLAWKNGTSWTFRIVDSVGITGEYSSMAVTPSGALAFAYRSYTYDQVLYRVIEINQ